MYSMTGTRIAVVAVVLNEAPRIAEWIAYHHAVGFDSVLLFDNASSDETVAVAKSLQPTVDVRVLDWPLRESSYQVRAYLDACRRYEEEFSWLAFFDTDEFVVPPDGKDLKELLIGLSGVDAVALPWAMFGSSGHHDTPGGLVIENYCNRADPKIRLDRHVKSIVRPERVIGVKNPHEFDIVGGYADLFGRPVSVKDGKSDSHLYAYECGKLHHYMTRSWRDWHAKIERGYRDTSRSLADFAMYDLNDVHDESACRYVEDVRVRLKTAASGGRRVLA